jgi:hypothetical protein
MEHRIERTGKQALTFDGELLAESSGQMVQDKNQNRWHELRLYRSDNGPYVAHVLYRTQWAGELGHSEAWLIGDPVDVPTEFDLVEPTQHVQGYPAHEQYAERQAHLLDWIERRYRSQVGELLGQLRELDERVG